MLRFNAFLLASVDMHGHNPLIAQVGPKRSFFDESMLKLDSLHPVARKLLEGETCTLSKTVPHLVRGARPSTERSRIPREVCLFRTNLIFDAPVSITSIALWGSVMELRTTTLVLELKGCAAAVQFALDLSGQHTDGNYVRFLSPIGLKSNEEFELFVCDDRLRTDLSAKLDLSRLEIIYFRATSSEIGNIGDTDPFDPMSACDLVNFEFEDDSQTIQANKFVLAAHSTVFKRQFFGNCTEAMTGRVTVTDFSSSSFRIFLSMLLDSRVAYTLLHSPAGVNMVEVWAIADKYCAKDVQNIAAAALLQSATPSNVQEILQACRRYRSAESLGCK